MHPTRPYTIGEDLELEADLGWRFCPRHGLARQRTKNNPLGDLARFSTETETNWPYKKRQWK